MINMIGSSTAKDFLIKRGFAPSGTCRCSGYFTEKYKKGNIEVKIRKAKYTFKITEDHSTLYSWQPLANLETVLNELDKMAI